MVSKIFFVILHKEDIQVKSDTHFQSLTYYKIYKSFPLGQYFHISHVQFLDHEESLNRVNATLYFLFAMKSR